MEKGEITMKTIPDEIWEKMQADIAEIKVALLGNEYNPEGALYQIKQNETCIRELRDSFNKMKWMAAGFGAFAGIVINIIIQVLFT